MTNQNVVIYMLGNCIQPNQLKCLFIESVTRSSEEGGTWYSYMYKEFELLIPTCIVNETS